MSVLSEAATEFQTNAAGYLSQINSDKLLIATVYLGEHEFDKNVLGNSPGAE